MKRNAKARWFWHMVERQRERELYADAHAELYAAGYRFQVSFYGTLAEPYDGSHVQARIEVLTNFELSVNQIRQLRGTFAGFRPVKEYTLLVWSNGDFHDVIPNGLRPSLAVA